MKKNIILFLILLINGASFAGETVYSKRTEKTELDPGYISNLNYYPQMPLSFNGAPSFSSYSAKVKLVYNRELQSDLDASNMFTFKVTGELNVDGNIYPLTVEIKNDGVDHIYMDYELVQIQGTQPSGILNFEILTVEGTYWDGSTFQTALNPAADPNIPSDIHLELSVKTERYYELEETKDTRMSIAENTNDIEIRWYFVEGAEEYDLEWVYIEKHDPEYANIIANAQDVAGDPAMPFNYKEPAGIRVNYNRYQIDKTFPQGAVFFRVRPVGRHTGSEVQGDYTYIKTGAWNYYYSSPYAGQNTDPALLIWVEIDQTNEFEPGMNWIYTIGFSDNGKYGSGVTFADGTFRVRQSTAYNSTDDVTLKSESFYDYEGRSSIGVSPAPVNGKDLSYEVGFNTVDDGGNSEPLSKEYFDIPDPYELENTNGISKYFSPNNDFEQENGWAIPDVMGFAYSKVEFKKDGTGRATKSGGIGAEFAINGNHATSYYYGSPTYVELKRLFGTNVADNNNYYKKQMVQDPNGQLSVVYQDGAGRTIATCLAGEPPTNLKDLDGTVETFTTPINTGNILTDEYTLESNFVFLNTVENNDIDLDYDFDGIIYDFGGVISQNLCEDCEYFLEIKIIDPNGVETAITENITAQTAFTCGVTTTYPTEFVTQGQSTVHIDYNCTEIGEYKIIKRLVVQTADMLDDATAALEDPNYLNNLINQYLDNADFSGCFTDCQDYCIEYIGNDYDAQAGNSPGDFQALLDLNDQVAWGMVDDCVADACNQSEIFNGDTDPNEQYPNNPFENLFAAQCEGYKTQLEDQIKPGGYLFELDCTTDQTFWNGTGNVADDLQSGSLLLYHDYDVNGNGIPPAITVVCDVANPSNWHNEWIPELLPYHREYCHYDLCADELDSRQFDAELITFINDPNGPINSTWSETVLSWFWSSSNTDPFVTTIFDPATELEDALQAFDISYFQSPCTPSATPVNLYQYIEAVSSCSGPFSQDQKWNMFIGLYQQTKQEIIDDYKLNVYPDCIYFNDDYAIFNNSSDSQPQNQNGANIVQNLNYDNIDVAVPDVLFVCDNNVISWMNDLPPTCYTSLDNLGLLDDLEQAFYDYCYAHCSSANPGGWFYNNGSPEYTAVINLLSNCSGYQPNYEILIPPASPISTVTTDLVDQNFPACYLLMIEFLNNEFLPNDGYLIQETDNPNVYEIPPTTQLYNCGPLPPSGQYKGWRLDGQDDTYLTEYSQDGTKLCEQFIQVKSKDPLYNLGGAIDWEYIEHIDNLFKVKQGPIEYLTADVTVSDLPTFAGVITCEIVFQPTGCYNPGSFQMMVVMDQPTDFGINSLTIPDWESDCIQQVQNEATQNAIDAYNNLLEGDQNAFLLNVDGCLSGINETFTLTYDILEYNYTLFYYDLAGNLVQTVSPEGVALLTPTDFNNNPADPLYGYHLGASNDPQHTLKTNYKFSGAGQLIESFSVDYGQVDYYYDDLLRPRFTQDAHQKVNDKFSYVIYDELGRPIESGEAGDGDTGNGLEDFASEMNNYSYPNLSLKRDRVTTYYGEGAPYGGATSIESVFINGEQENLYAQVGAVVKYTADYEQVTAGSPNISPILGTEVESISSYSYDFHGNVKEVVQTNSHLAFLEQDHKHFEYQYDLISGNTEEVIYQGGQMDEWRHKYHYDASNRLVRVFTSDDGEEWEMDAKYFYYLHGSLSRVERGHDKVQGNDYVFNSQGWYKGLNSTFLDPSKDVGQDGHDTGLDKFSGQDVYAYSLSYFDGDYTSISGTNYFASTSYLQSINVDGNGDYGDLYNGNIAAMVVALKDENENPLNVHCNNYTYDLLQRIKSMEVFQVDASTQSTYADYQLNGFTGSNAVNNGAYRTNYTFDANGNLDFLQRYDNQAKLMDDFVYSYDDGNGRYNRLLHVADNAPTSGGLQSLVTTDIENDTDPLHFAYDEKGQMTDDYIEDLHIEWTADGKVRKIQKLNGDQVEFVYDAAGNRIIKVDGGINYTESVYTYYVYDGAGNLMATYERIVELPTGVGHEDILDQISLGEQYIYGAARLGNKTKKGDRIMANREFTVAAGEGNPFYSTQGGGKPLVEYPQNFDKTNRELDQKTYELNSHQNNVMEVVTDRKIPNQDETAYTADIISYSDYYPYGIVMPGRNGSAAGGDYRYSFQGQEKDDEIKGEGNSINYKYRMHDPRIGRFFAVDPLSPKYPHNSPYAFSENRVTDGIELEGLEYTSDEGVLYGAGGEGSGSRSFEDYQNEVVNGGNSSSTNITASGPKEYTGVIGTVDPYAGAKIEPYARLSTNTDYVLLDWGHAFLNGVGRTPLNSIIQGWNEAVDVFSGNASIDATVDQAKQVGNNIVNYVQNTGTSEFWQFDPADLSDPQKWEGPLGFGTSLALGGGGLGGVKVPKLSFSKPAFPNFLQGGKTFNQYKLANGGGGLVGEVPLVKFHPYYGNTFPVRVEFSHRWITQSAQRKYNLPNWMVNNSLNVRRTNTFIHASHDPFRFRFLPQEIKFRLGPNGDLDFKMFGN